MKATIENNRAALGLMAVLVVVILGFVWWQFLYKPATVDNNAAMLANQTAQAALSDAQSRLTKAQQEVDAAKRENGGKFDDAIAKVQVAREAVPNEARIDDALIVLQKYAKRSGIRTNWNISTSGDDIITSTAPAAAGDAKPVTIKLKAVGEWKELKTFIGLVESSASNERGNLHVRGRIFNVVQVRVSTPETAQQDGSTDFSGQATAQTELMPGKNEYKYDLAIEMYTSDFGAPAGAAAGTAASGAAAGTGADASTAAAGTSTTPGASTSTPSGTSSTTGTGTGTSTGSSTTPGATGTGSSTSTTPSTGTSTSPTGATSSPTATGSTPTTGTPTGTSAMPSTTGATG